MLVHTNLRNGAQPPRPPQLAFEYSYYNTFWAGSQTAGKDPPKDMLLTKFSKPAIIHV